MPPGPVFYAELLTSARRFRNYLGRSFYGLFLLVIVSQAYLSLFGDSLFRSPEVSIRAMADFGRGLFHTFVVCQALAVMLLTPALVAGAIADERQRKTLHYLLASRLSGAEIVLGKLGARLLVLGVYVTAGLPILSMLVLFGGVAPELVAWSYAGTLSMLLALAGLSIFLSVGARRPRDAILLAFAIETCWLFAPLLVESVRNEWPVMHAAIEPALEWVWLTNPFHVASGANNRLSFSESMLVMIATHLGTFFVTTLWAVVRLRPVLRNEGGRSFLVRVLTKPRGRWRIFPRPTCGADPMMWKERHIARLRGRTRAILSLLGLLLLVFLGYWTIKFAGEAWWELAANDLFAFQYGSKRDAFHDFLGIASVFLYLVIAVGVAVAAASAFTSEREEDTWTSLVSTTLTGPEIVLAKLLGSIESMRLMLLALVLLWAVGMATGSLHPYGFLAGLADLVCFLGFIAALGVTISLHARTTARALASTIALLVFLNGGYFIFLILSLPDTALVTVGVSPFLLHMSLVSYQDVWSILGWGDGRFQPVWDQEWGATLILGPLSYGLAGMVLSWRACALFDDLIDRPRLEVANVRPARVDSEE